MKSSVKLKNLYKKLSEFYFITNLKLKIPAKEAISFMNFFFMKRA